MTETQGAMLLFFFASCVMWARPLPHGWSLFPHLGNENNKACFHHFSLEGLNQLILHVEDRGRVPLRLAVILGTQFRSLFFPP